MHTRLIRYHLTPTIKNTGVMNQTIVISEEDEDSWPLNDEIQPSLQPNFLSPWNIQSLQRYQKRLKRQLIDANCDLTQGNSFPDFNDIYLMRDFVALLTGKLSELRDWQGDLIDVWYSGDKQRYDSSSYVENEVTVQRWAEVNVNCNNKKCLPPEHYWNPYYGFMQFKFFFEPAQRYFSSQEVDQMKYPYILRFQVHLQQQKCYKCKQKAPSEIMWDKVSYLTDIFVLIVQLSICHNNSPCQRRLQFGDIGRDDILIGREIVRLRGVKYHYPLRLCQECHSGICRHFTSRQINEHRH